MPHWTTIGPSRRQLVAGVGLTTAGLALGRMSHAAEPSPIPLEMRLHAAEAALGESRPSSPTWELDAPLPKLIQGDIVDLGVRNELPVPVVLTWRGAPWAASIEPLLAQPPLTPGQSVRMRVPLAHAGTVLCDMHLLGDTGQRPLPAIGFGVAERTPPTVDGDHLLTITEWRVRPDGTLVAPGQEAGDAAAQFTVNGKPALDIPTVAGARLRLRFVNACQRSLVAIRLDDHQPVVMALDGQPAAPFRARDGQLLLAPGTRLDTFVDMLGKPGMTSTIWLHDGTSPRPVGRLVYRKDDPIRRPPLGEPKPLPDNGLPQRLALGQARRVDLPIETAPSADWQLPSAQIGKVAPVFRARRGDTVVLSLINRAAAPATFHLHGHPFRWLSPLDDAWKPFWLDTLLLPPGQTLRIAFLAEHPGSWMLEAIGTNWSGRRLVRWYAVD